MAEDKSATTTDEDAVDTSTNDDADADADFEDDTTSWDEGEDDGSDDDSKDDDAAADSTDDDDSDSEDDDESEDSEDDDSAKADEEDSEDEDSDDKSDKKDKSDEKDTLSPEERKRHNDEMAKARMAEKKAREDAQKAEKDAQEATIERYLREAGEDKAELERRQLNVDAWRVQQEKVSVNEEKLQTGLERAVATIPLFRTGSQAVQEELLAAADDFERLYVKKDKNGRPIEVLGDVVQYLQNKAKSIERLQADGAVTQDKSKKKQKSRTTTPPVRSPKKGKKDAQVDAFDAEAARY